MKCVRCKKRESEFDAPEALCAECWHDWWFLDDTADLTDEQIIERMEERAIALKEFKSKQHEEAR